MSADDTRHRDLPASSHGCFAQFKISKESHERNLCQTSTIRRQNNQCDNLIFDSIQSEKTTGVKIKRTHCTEVGKSADSSSRMTSAWRPQIWQHLRAMKTLSEKTEGTREALETLSSPASGRMLRNIGFWILVAVLICRKAGATAFDCLPLEMSLSSLAPTLASARPDVLKCGKALAQWKHGEIQLKERSLRKTAAEGFSASCLLRYPGLGSKGLQPLRPTLGGGREGF